MKPRLRFKEYNNDYTNGKLKEFVEVYDGTHETPNYVSNGVRFVSVENINNLLNSNKFIPIEDFNKYKIKPQNNDIFMTRIGDIGTSTIYKSNEPLAYYVSLALLRSKKELILYPDYLNQYIKNNRFQKELHDRTIHVAFPKKINTGEIGECNIAIPDYEEQVKISNFLSLLDKRIELQSKKIEDLKLFKKGLFDKLFKDIDGDNYLLSDIAKFENGKGHENIIDDNGKYILINSKFISTEGNIIKKCSEQLTPLFKDDITIVMSDLPNGKALAKCYYIEEDNKYSLNQRICKIHIKDNKFINSKYLFYLLNRNPYFLKFDDGVNQTNLKKDDILNINLIIPTIEVQKKNSKILTTIDNLINKESAKLSKLEALKKGLMQNMFV